jgi:hypothetical protein
MAGEADSAPCAKAAASSIAANAKCTKFRSIRLSRAKEVPLDFILPSFQSQAIFEARIDIEAIDRDRAN